MVDKPLLFISHKHSDADIARRVAQFVRTVTAGGVDVFLSSNPDFEGPRVGKALGDELKNALWRAGIVILIYTSEDQDWSWCMWECGLAEDPNSADTKVVVIQCLPDEPQIFDGSVRVVASEPASVIGFANRFLDSDFLPGNDRPLTGLEPKELEQLATELATDLHDLIPQEPPENWSAWPFMRLELPHDIVIGVLKSEPKTARVGAMRDALSESCIIHETASGLAQLFGRAEVSPGSPLSDLVDDWQEYFPDDDPDWLTSLAAQILQAARKRTPKDDWWARFREAEEDDEFIIGVGRVKKNPSSFSFDCFFFRLPSPSEG